MRLEEIHIAVVVEVRADHAVAHLGIRHAHRLRALEKAAVAFGKKQPACVRVEVARLERLRPAVGVVDVQVPVQVEVRETSAPTPAAVRHPRAFGNIEELAEGVAVEAVAEREHAPAAVVRDAQYGRDEPIQVAIAVVVAERRTHAVAVDDHAPVRDVAEGAVAVVHERH